jgi:hypothetical protein
VSDSDNRIDLDNNIIVIQNLMKVYKGGVDVVALDNINLQIKKASFWPSSAQAGAERAPC